MVTPLLRYTKKVLFLTIPVAAVAGYVVAEHFEMQGSHGLLFGGLGPLTLALAIDHYLNRDTANR
jgi:hypothetical protein